MNPEIEVSSQPSDSSQPADGHPPLRRRPDTKELHVRVSVNNYQYLDQIAIRYGIRSLSAAVNFLIEFHRQSQVPPTLGLDSFSTKQAE